MVRLTYFLLARFSAILCREMLLVNFETPIAFCRRPETGRGFLAPPLLTLTLTSTIPCFALYPKRRARSSLVGCGIRLTTGSFLQPTTERRSHSFSSGVFSLHWSAKWEYDKFFPLTLRLRSEEHTSELQSRE